MKTSFDSINEEIKELIEKRVYCNMPILKLAKLYSLKIDEVRDILDEHSEYVKYITKERRLIAQKKYKRLDKMSYKALEEILKTNAEVPIMSLVDGVMIEVGKRIDDKILKIKEKVATDVLKNVGAMKDTSMKSKGITVNNQFNASKGRIRDHEVNILEAKKRESVLKLLDKCIVVEAEKAS